MGKAKTEKLYIIDNWWDHQDYLGRERPPDAEVKKWLHGLMDAPEKSVLVRLIPKGGFFWIRLVRGESDDRFDARPVAQKLSELYRDALPDWPERPNVATVEPPRHGKDTYVPVQCLNDLLYSVRDGKLKDCPIWIQALGTEVKSLNLAYTRLSECFELGRRVFGGNVFLNTFVNEQTPSGMPSREYPLHLTQLDIIRRCIEDGLGRYRNAMEPPFAHAFRYVNEKDRLGSALLVAERLHHAQRRKGGTIPYFSHLMAVAAGVMECGGTDDEVIAALLHDAAEDQGGEAVLEEIEYAFGKKVAALVHACSDTFENPKPKWKERKDRHLAHLPSAPKGALRIIAADKLHNLRSMLRDHYAIGARLWDRFNTDAANILWYHREVTAIVRRKGLEDMAAELERVLDELTFRVRLEQEEERRRHWAHRSGLVGLESLHDRIHDIALRAESGDTSEVKTFPHTLFVGGTGTGKTKTVRLFAEVQHSAGYTTVAEPLYESAVVLGDRAWRGLAVTMNSLEKDAKGRLLVIQDLERLLRLGTDDLRVTSFAALLPGILDMRKEGPPVALVGNAEAFAGLWSVDPDLQYRFGVVYRFPNLTLPQLLTVAKLRAGRRKLLWSDDALKILRDHLKRVLRKAADTDADATPALPGGARYLARIVDILHEALPFVPGVEAGRREITAATLLDALRTLGEEEGEQALPPTPVDETGLAAAMEELDRLVGMEEFRRDMHDLVDLARHYRETGTPLASLVTHMVFTGNPGTGKTTVARLYAQILRALGLLKKGHLVETDRSGLVGEYIGHTAQKTGKVIDRAIGGVLFIDEAYALVPPDPMRDYGREAIETLLKRMEDDRGSFVVIVAGYPREMRRFLDHNPGMRSRFDDTYHFRDLTTEELLEVAAQMLAREGLRLAGETRLHLASHFHRLLLDAGESFGNARESRTLVRKIVKTQRLRLARSGGADTPADLVLPEDVLPHLAKRPGEKKKKGGMGFKP